MMKLTLPKKVLTAAAALALVGGTLAATPAYAGQKYRNHYDSHHYSNSYSRHYRSRYSGRHRGHGVSKTGNFLLGIGAGVILNSILSKPRSSGYYDNSRYRYDDRYANRYDDRYVSYNRDVVRMPAEPVRYMPAPEPRYEAELSVEADGCLMTREYQTIIVVGGVEHDAYGTACMMADGSWRQGPAQTVPDY